MLFCTSFVANAEPITYDLSVQFGPDTFENDALISFLLEASITSDTEDFGDFGPGQTGFLQPTAFDFQVDIAIFIGEIEAQH